MKQDPFYYFGEKARTGAPHVLINDNRSYIEVPPSILKSCEEYANKNLPTVKSSYARRGQANTSKVLNDIFEGKVTEWIAHLLLKERGHEVTEPEMDIKNKSQKRHGKDMTVLTNSGHKEAKLHIKGRNAKWSSMFNNDSWQFQYGNNKDKEILEQRYRPLKNSSGSDFAFFVLSFFDRSEVFGTVLACPSIESLHHEELFGLPERDDLEGEKRTVYFDDIPRKTYQKGWKNSISNTRIRKWELFEFLNLSIKK